MNNLLLRRRALMGMGGTQSGQYAVTAVDNPEWMNYLYHRGIAASPDYCTFEEAAAVTTFSSDVQYPDYTTPNPIPHVDLRWFINTSNITGGGRPITKITLPAISDVEPIAPVNSFFERYINGDTYIVVLPKEVNKFDPFFINAAAKNCIWVIENPIPPGMSNHYYLNNGEVNKVLGVYVPDEAVEVYKTTDIVVNKSLKKQYSRYADVIFPISQYSK